VKLGDRDATSKNGSTCSGAASPHTDPRAGQNRSKPRHRSEPR